MSNKIKPTDFIESFVVKVPKTKHQNRIYKKGFVDDNNEHLSYVSMQLIYPTASLTVICYIALFIGIAGSIYIDRLPKAPTPNGVRWTFHGSKPYRCNNTAPPPKNGLPSVLLLFEMNDLGNEMFRICTCLPIVIRFFLVICRRAMIRADFASSSFLHHQMNDAVVSLTIVELLTMALFSVVTVRKDFPDFNQYCKIVFAITAGLNMLLTSAIVIAQKKDTSTTEDSISIMMKILFTTIYCLASPYYFKYHHSTIIVKICHYYLPRSYAVLEYVTIFAYGSFHLSSLIDIRNLSFCCYPRSCSGECESLDSRNFLKGAKYEHCRAFEYQQRQGGASISIRVND